MTIPAKNLQSKTENRGWFGTPQRRCKLCHTKMENERGDVHKACEEKFMREQEGDAISYD